MIYSMKKLKKKYYQNRNKVLLKIIKKDFKIWQENIKFKMKKGYTWDSRYIWEIERNANISILRTEIKMIFETYKTFVEQKGYKVKLNIAGKYMELIWEE